MTSSDPDIDPDPTQRTCLSCGGNAIVGGHTCRYCTAGFMTAEQEAYWRKYRSGTHPAISDSDD